MIPPRSWSATARRGKRAFAYEADEESEESFEDEEGDGSCSEGYGGIESAGASTRSSVKRVSSVIAKFDSVKKELVKEIDFDGLLELPQINKVDRNFTVWLLSKVDTESRTILVNGEPQVDMVDLDVERILGVPCGRRKVSSLPNDDVRSRKKFLTDCLGALPNEANSLVAATRVITQDYNGHMTKKQKDQFKVAFVVFVVGHFLAPTTKNNFGNSTFWGALQNPDEISEHNWGQYVIDNLMEAAKKVQVAIRSKKRVYRITGCAVFLQILYLDSLDMGHLNPDKETVPRIKVFSCQILRQMIQADQSVASSSAVPHAWGSTLMSRKPGHASPFDYSGSVSKFLMDNFGGQISESQKQAIESHTRRCDEHFTTLKNSLMKENLQLLENIFDAAVLSQRLKMSSSFVTPMKPQTTVRFSGAPVSEGTNKPRISTPAGYERAQKLFEARKRAKMPETILSGGYYSDTQLLTKPTGVAVPRLGDLSRRSTGIDAPLFDLGIEFQTQSKAMAAGVHQTANTDGKDAASASSNVEEIAVPELQQLENAPVDSDNNTLCPVKKPSGIAEWRTPDRRIRSSTITPASYIKILADNEVFGRISREDEEININLTPWENQEAASPVAKVSVGAGRLAKSPWFHELSHDNTDSDVAEEIYKEVMSATNDQLNSPWIIHVKPRSIEVSGSNLKEAFSLSHDLTYEAYDLAVRRLKQLERNMYHGTSHLRWRHIMESDFSVIALAEHKPCDIKAIREQMIGEAVTHNIRRCRMIVVPAQLLLNWCCYFWDMKKQCVHVFDPYYRSGEQEFSREMHKPVVKQLATALASCTEKFFDGWKMETDSWPTVFLDPPIEIAQRNETGLMSLLAIREFDGETFKNYDKDSYAKFKAVMLADLLSLEENEVTAPFARPREAKKIVHTIDD